MEVKVRVWDRSQKKYINPTHIYLTVHGTLNINKNKLEVEQFIGIPDKKGKDIFKNDIVRIRVSRYGDNNSHSNIHHSEEFPKKDSNKKIFYLNALVKDVYGDLVYNKEEIDALKAPKGKERYTQHVAYDYSLIDSMHGHWGLVYDRYADKHYRDVEVIGNLNENSELWLRKE